MVVLMKVLLSLFILLSFLACQKKNEVVESPVMIQSGIYSTEISTLIQDNNRLQLDLAEDTIMRSSTNDQRNLFREFLVRSRRALIVLLDNPKNETVLKELEDIVFEAGNLIITVTDQSYIAPYISKLEDLIESLYLNQGGVAENYLIKFQFDEENAQKLLMEKEENAADFTNRENEHGPYVGVDSFGQKNDGTTIAITPTIALESMLYSVRFEYLVRFYARDARDQKLIKFFVGEDREDVSTIEWIDLDVEIGPDASSFSDPPSVTNDINLDFVDTDIRFKIEYTSKAADKFFPAFNLFKLEVLEK